MLSHWTWIRTWTILFHLKNMEQYNTSFILWYVYTYTDPTRTPLNCCPWRTTPLISAKFTARRDTDNAHGNKTVVTRMQHGCSRTWHGRQTDTTRTARMQCGYDTNMTRTAWMKHGHDTGVTRTWWGRDTDTVRATNCGLGTQEFK